MTGIELYTAVSRPPKDVLKKIEGGKINGFTDINPQWRYRVMTEMFGSVGYGWRPKVKKFWKEDGANGEVLVFCKVAIYIKEGENWSEPFDGVGGSKLIALEKGKLVSNDEGYKMAYTDAMSNAMRLLGVGADIYAGRFDGSKYREPPKEDAETEALQKLIDDNASILGKGLINSPYEKARECIENGGDIKAMTERVNSYLEKKKVV